LNLSYVPQKQVGRTHRASDRALPQTKTMTLSNYRLALKGNEKESPSKCLQKLHLTERGNSIQNAVRLIFTDDEFSMV